MAMRPEPWRLAGLASAGCAACVVVVVALASGCGSRTGLEALGGSGSTGTSGSSGGTGEDGGSTTGSECIVSDGTPVAIATDTSAPINLAVDSASVYWTDAAGDVMKSPLCGGGSVVLGSGQGTLTGIAVDGESVYWGGSAGVSKVALDGGTPQLLAPGTQVSAIALDATNVYWTDAASGAAGLVESVPVTGGAVSTLAELSGYPSPVIAVDATSVYWIARDEGLVRIAKTGGPIVTLAPSIPLGPIAVDATQVYWQGDGADLFSVMSESKAGGTPGRLAGDQDGVTRFAVDDTDVYWMIGTGTGTIVLIPASGGSPVTLVQSDAATAGLAVDGTSVYWAESTSEEPGDAGGSGVQPVSARVMKLTPK